MTDYPCSVNGKVVDGITEIEGASVFISYNGGTLKVNKTTTNATGDYVFNVLGDLVNKSHISAEIENGQTYSYPFVEPNIDWNTFYTYTTNATHSIVNAWIGADISTNPTIPSTIESKQVIVNSNTTFRGNTALTNVSIEDNVKFEYLGDANNMRNCFNGCSNLIGVNSIPDDVTSMNYTFRACSNLVNAPTIGINVTSMYYTFYNCTKLVNAPTIGINVTNMAYTFRGCSNLVNAPTIGINVTNMAYTFYNCTKLVNAPTIGINVTSMYYTFRGCSNLVNAPTIPDNVTNMGYTFYECTNLIGDITIINTSVTNFTECFYGTNESKAKTVYCPADSATYNLAINVIDGKNGVTVVAY